MNTTAKILTLFGMLSTVAWFFWNPDGWMFQWEPVVVFLFSLAGFIAAEVKSEHTPVVSAKNELHPNDIALFHKLLELLPSNGVIDFLRHHDFLGDFDQESVRPIHEFLMLWDNAEHEFQNSGLEIKRKALLEAAKDLSYKIAKYTSPNRHGRQAVRVDDLRHQEEHEIRFEREARIINKAADVAVNVHQDLVREARHYAI